MSTLGGSFADVGACLLVVFIHGEVFDVPLDYGDSVDWSHFGK